MSYFSKLAQMKTSDVHQFLQTLSLKELKLLNEEFIFSAHPHQRPPVVDYTTWLILGGRGAGKTRAGAEAVIDAIRHYHIRNIALIGETLHDVSDVMVTGLSGIMAIAPPHLRPHYVRAERRLEWSNGAKAFLFSSKDPDSLRGPQFDFAWCDELAKWSYPQETWDMLQFGLRLGKRPRQIVTTTPRPMALLRMIVNRSDTIISHAPTSSNKAYLAPAFFDTVVKKYQGTRLGQQELEGQMFDDYEGALWSRDMLDKCRLDKIPDDMMRIVVAVDPPTSATEGSDECGIIVAGIAHTTKDGQASKRAYVLADYSVRGLSPRGWAEIAVRAYYDHRADRLVAESNQGGDMVRTIIHSIDSTVSYKAVWAKRGKVSRAEPIAALYERGDVYHIGRFDQLEDQMCCFTLDHIYAHGTRSPDRVDALVWALTELMLNNGGGEPKVHSF